MNNIPQCECAQPGYCPVLGMKVGPKKLALCQRSEVARAHMRGVTIAPRHATVRRAPRRDKSTIGTMLHQLLVRVNNGQDIECSDCRREVQRLNQMTAAEVRAERIPLAARILERLKVKAPKWWQRWGATLAPDFARQRLLEMIDQAIEEGGHWAAVEVPRRKKRKAGAAVRRGRSVNRSWRSSFVNDGAPIEYVTLERFATDVKELIGMLPARVSAVVGVSRSGMDVAAIIAKQLHLHLFALAQDRGEIVSCGSGYRIKSGRQPNGPALVVDDTVMTGNTQKAIRPLIGKRFSDAVFAAVYVNPHAKVVPDVWVKHLAWPHLLEWNLFNSVLSPFAAVDFDGVLCHDCPPQDDDDGPRYSAFLASAKLRFVPRRVSIPLIVTARLEKYRPQTQAWLRGHGITVARMVMGPWKTKQERSRSDIAAFKAEYFSKWARTTGNVAFRPMFIESDDHQAQRIHKLTGLLVVCPSSASCYYERY